jgi:hypothetical protein
MTVMVPQLYANGSLYAHSSAIVEAYDAPVGLCFRMRYKLHSDQSSAQPDNAVTNLVRGWKCWGDIRRRMPRTHQLASKLPLSGPKLIFLRPYQRILMNLGYRLQI